MGQMKEHEIIEMTSAKQGDYELRDYVFTVIGRIVPRLQNDEWSDREELFKQTYESHYPEYEKLDEYIDSEDSAAFCIIPKVIA